jgi:NADH-quinone oxidoreductase subunit N
MNWGDVLVSMLPEHLLLLGIVLTLALEIAGGSERGGFKTAVATVILAGLGALFLLAGGFAAEPFPGHYVVDPTTTMAKLVLMILALPMLLVSRDDFVERRYFVLVLSSLYGACLIISSSSFPTLFLGLELMSLPVYTLVLLAMLRPESTEAALKYLVMGSAATAAFLMGVSLLYGWSGSMHLTAFAEAVQSSQGMPIAGVVLITAALFLKGAVVPFHAWAPDAYEGASLPVTAYMATIIKAAVLLAALRLFSTAEVPATLIGLLALLPLVSMAWGNLAAIRQTSFRRMIAYSSIAHAGYLFFAFLGAGDGRYEAIVFYLVAYGLMSLLAFSALPRGVDDAALDRLDSLKGLFHRQPLAAIVIAAAMLSLAGIPPLPGFVAKFLVFRSVLAAGHTTYAVLGLVASYLGLYFYLRVIQYMFMGAPEASAARGDPRRLARLAIGLCLVPAVLLAFFPGWLLDRL